VILCVGGPAIDLRPMFDKYPIVIFCRICRSQIIFLFENFKRVAFGVYIAKPIEKLKINFE